MNSYLSACANLLMERKLTIAFAESATAGRMAAEFSLLPKAGCFLKGGLVCYDAGVKEKYLGVSHDLIERFTPESAEVTKAAAQGLTEFMEADVHVVITGLPSPGGSETAEKPVGTMFIAAFYKGDPLFNDRIVFEGEAEEIILQSISHTAKLLLQKLND